MVGAVGFELTTTWSQTRCATRLRYAPKSKILCCQMQDPSRTAKIFQNKCPMRPTHGAWAQCVICAHAFSRRLALTGCGVRNS